MTTEMNAITQRLAAEKARRRIDPIEVRNLMKKIKKLECEVASARLLNPITQEAKLSVDSYTAESLKGLNRLHSLLTATKALQKEQ